MKISPKFLSKCVIKKLFIYYKINREHRFFPSFFFHGGVGSKFEDFQMFSNVTFNKLVKHFGR